MQHDGRFDPLPLRLRSDDADQFAVAWCRGTWLVVLREVDGFQGLPGLQFADRFDLRAARISDAGTVLDAIPFALAERTAQDWDPAVATNGRDFLVVWRTGYAHNVIRARRVPVSGFVEIEGIFNPPMEIARGWLDGTSVAWTGDDYVIAWGRLQTDERQSDDLFFRMLRGTVAFPMAATADRELNPRLVGSDGGFVAAYERMAMESPFLAVRRAFLRLDLRKAARGEAVIVSASVP